ncbi:Hypothetical predicted protein [Olea europaea subsp. europaea]|uniref:AIPP2-like SPOC-like domain-containing protein n=1 Tax=Olea europaea subsp. europaea TaxID=158383 RepID=A0A8S0Q8H5_OLEEU|nr:Hypothetical predicted protein [Olea europaea subsp. europaea]
MRNYYEDYPTDWHCDECEPRAESRGDLLRGSELINSGTVCHDATRSIKSRTLSNETRRGSLNWEKKVVTGRTKFIPVNEAIKLSSGAPKITSFKMVTRHSSPPLLQMGVNLLAKTSIKPQIIPMESSTYRGRAKYASGPSQEKPQRQGNVKISWRQQQSKELGVQRLVNFSQAASTSIDEHIQKERTAEVVNSIKKLSPASLPSVSPPVLISGSDDCHDVEPGISNAENMNDGILPDVEPRTSDAEKANNELRTSSAANCADESSCNPARCVVWMGSFSIHNGFKHGTLCDPVYAHPSGKIHRKVYEYSKLMPEVLHFELFPCGELWTNLFQEYGLDRKNIGLYFLPSASKRSEDYFSLLESMIKKDLALRKQIADVELMLFPSTRLTLDCQRWNGKYFLWGLFRRKKRDEVACQDRAFYSYTRPSKDCKESTATTTSHGSRR